jgi:adenosine/AMP kinase
MSTFYNINRWLNGFNGFGLAFTVDNYTVSLSASTDTTLTVPTIFIPGITYASSVIPCIAIISYDVATPADVWVALNATAAIPAGHTFAISNSTLNPNARVVNAGDVIHFFTATANTEVCVSFYGIQER